MDKPDIFISYSHRDQEFVDKLCHALKQNWNLWVDGESIPVSADWRQEIREGIEAAHTFLFVISPDSVNSKHCKDEITYANELNKRRIPILFRREYCEKKYKATKLDSLQWVSFAEQPEEQPSDDALQKLLAAITTNLKLVKHSTTLLGRALEWDRADRQDGFLMNAQVLGKTQQWVKELQQVRDCQLELSPLQQTYIDASCKVVKIRRRTYQLIATLMIGLVVGLVGLSVLSATATMGEIRALVASLEERKGLDALIGALKAGKKLKQNSWLIRMQSPALRAKAVTVLHRETYNLREINRLEGHRGRIFSIAVSADGQFIASAGEDLTVRLWTCNCSKSAVRHPTTMRHP